MTSHRPPPPARNSRWFWPIMTAAVAGVVLPPVVWSAQHVAPHPAAAQTFTIPPEQVAEPTAHGGPLAPMSIGTTVTDDSAYGPDPLSAPRTAAGPRSGLSGGLTRASNAPTGLSEAFTASVSPTVVPPSATETAPVTTTAAASPPPTTPAATTTPPTTSPSPSPTATVTTTDVAATTTTASGSSDDD